MSRLKSYPIAITAAVLGIVLTTAGPVQAALIDCPPIYTSALNSQVENSAGTMTAVSACQYVSPADPGNVASIANLNTAGFFGFGDWQDNGQTQLADSGSIGQFGSWAISNVNFAAYDYIMVFKDGPGTNLTAFLFNETAADGAWTTPFFNPPFDLPPGKFSEDVTHLTIARRPMLAVPEPASLAIFGTALAGLALIRRRRRLG